MGKPDYEQLMGNWVAARCRARAERHKPMPKKVQRWLGTLKWNPGAGGSRAPGQVLGWLFHTIVDPDWAEPD
jgi:hypothetical protein